MVGSGATARERDRPRSFHLPYQMRESPGYAPVLSDAVPVACGADSAASRGRRVQMERLHFSDNFSYINYFNLSYG